MEMKKEALIPLFLFCFINHVSGAIIPPPKKLEVHISDGVVTVLWEHPEDAPPEAVYNVQMRTHNQWENVPNCMGVRINYCLISNISNYLPKYQVKVQLVKGLQKSDWEVSKKFLINEGELLPPSFTLWATSSKLTVYVHEKPILRKVFPFGVAYTLYLEEIGEVNKTTTVYLKDDEGKAMRTKTFSSLHWGRMYCVSGKVEGNGGLNSSPVSEKQCLFLPEQEFYIIAASSLSILGIMAFAIVITSIVLCYLKRPAKTPVALKSPVSGWMPLSVAEGTMEVVTDKAWFLSSYKINTKPINLPETTITITDNGEEENRRTSLDSGVSVETDPAAKRGQCPARQEDSGCGSMGGPESSSNSHTDYPLQDESMEADDIRKTEDSGMGLSCQMHSSSLNLYGQDTETLVETVIVGNYRTQSPSEIQIQSRDSEDMLKQIPAHTVLAEVVAGYKAGPQSCICSETGQCTWCLRHGLYRPEETKLCRTVFMEDLLIDRKSEMVDSTTAVKTHMDSVINFETTLLQLSEAFPLLTSTFEKDSNMNISLSLCDVELTTD
ncbi:PREDICTED: interferon alpha/beta receptor 1-like [Cyprinodon variegatus]|uniref:Interleukin 10 receptor, alpha n=1 Tax=Cyprinodon variegatus TaxID=28743 RepID=A0A3Q2GML0_CYPVA|nr:PREDICTED: interferon alpha/beta receptor 1-like [Cyprinodon variegatus]